jgi:heme exporter protein C
MRLTTYAAPSRFWQLSGALLPWLWACAALCALSGLAVGLLHAPADAQQGDAYRIIFIHVPAAWMSMVIYLAMAAWAAVGWVWNVRLASMLARALAPTGLACTALALVTGSFWGKPTWGTWWVWDARLTSELILLLLYAGYLALVESIDDPRRADRAGALVAVVGVVNVPLIYFSVRWWNTLHQGATLTLGRAPSMADSMLLGMGLMALAFWAWAFAIVFVRVRAIVLERERETDWVRALDAPERPASATSPDLHGAAA